MKTRMFAAASVVLAGVACGYNPPLGSPAIAGGTHVACAVRRAECDVTFTAVPTKSGTVVDHATIEIDGRKVAEARQTTPGPFGGQVTLTAPLKGSD